MGKSHKQPIITDYNKGAKKMSHGKFRKVVKQKIQVGDFDSLPEDEREITNQYDICDWKFHASRGDDWYEKATRK